MADDGLEIPDNDRGQRTSERLGQCESNLIRIGTIRRLTLAEESAQDMFS